MDAQDPWAAFNPQPAPSAQPTPVFGARPVIQEAPPQPSPQTPDMAAETHARALSSQIDLKTKEEAYAAAHVAENPALVGLSGNDLLSKLPSDESPLVKGMIEGRITPPTASALKDPAWQQRIKWASQVDPAFDESQWQARVKGRSDIVSGRLGKSQNSLNTAIGHAGQLMSLIPDVASHSGLGPLDRTVNAVQNSLGRAGDSTGITQWDYTANQLSNELEAAYTGGQGSEQGRERQLANLSGNMTADQKQANIHRALDLLASKAAANLAQYQWAFVGNKPTWDMLDSDARDTLQKYAPDVLNKYFAAPTAWGQHGGPSPPDGPTSAGGGPPPDVTPPTNGKSETYDAQGSAFVDNMVKQGVPYHDAVNQWQQFNQQRGLQVQTPFGPDQYNAALAFAKAHPNTEYHPTQAITSKPISGAEQTVSQAAESGPGVALISAGNAFAGGIPMAAAGDKGAYFNQLAQTQHPDAQLAGTIIGGTAGALAGEAALGRAGMAPGFARSLAADSGYGALSGATSNPSDPVMGAVGGGLAGAAGSVAGQALVRGGAAALRGVTSKDVSALADAGVQPMTVGQIVSQSGRAGGMVKAAEDRLSGFSGVGDMIQGRRLEGLKSFNSKAFDKALGTIGASVNGATGEEAVQKASEAVSNAFSGALKGKMAVPDQEFISAARGPLERLARNPRVGPEIVDAIEGTTQGLFDTNTGAISGEHMQAFLDALRQIRTGYKSDPLYQTLIKPSVQGIENAVEGMFRRQAPEVMPQFNRAKAAYRQVSTLADAVNSGVNTDGLFTPAQLGNVSRANGKKFNGAISTASGDRPFSEMQRAAQNVLPSKIPDSGTAGRLALAAGAGSLPAAGAGVGYLSGDTKTGAETGLGLTALLAALYSRGGQAGLSKLLLSRSPRAREIAQKMLERAPIAGAAGTALTQTGPR